MAKSKDVLESHTTVKKEGGEKGGMFDMEDQFAFYGQYHVNKVNIAIHIFCVPLIFWSALVLTGINPKSLGHIKIGNFDLDVTLNFLWGFSYAAYFIILEPLAGLLYAPILLGMAYSSNVLPRMYPDIIKIALPVHIFSWLAQFYGHGVHEGRAPALIDNLFQSIVLAVFFVWMEVLFGLGYKPALHKRLQNRIGKEVAAYRKGRHANVRVGGK